MGGEWSENSWLKYIYNCSCVSEQLERARDQKALHADYTL